MNTPKAPVAPWFQPKSKTQLFFVVGGLFATIVAAWVGGLAWLNKKSADMPAPFMQKANALYGERKYDEAAALLTDSIAQIEKSQGAESMYLVKPLDLLAMVCEGMKKEADAEKHWRRSFDIRRKFLDRDHPEVIASGDKLGLCLIGEGKYAEAEALLKKSLAHREAYFGSDHKDIMRSLNNMAELYLAQKKYPEAQAFADRAVKIGRTNIGLLPAAYPDSQRCLAAALAGQEKYADAIPLYDAAVKAKAKLLPDAPHIPPKPDQISHGDFADLCKEYAAVLRKGGKEKDAKELEAKAEAVLKPKE